MERSGFLLGAGFGAGIMYVLDPLCGRRRRALAREKVVSAVSRADHVIGATARNMANRARGVLAEARWSPTTRALAGATGVALVARAVARRTFASGTLGVLGLGLTARALSNLELRRVLRMGRGRRAVDVQKTIDIAAPVETVFDFWRHYENFPRFMSNVRDVRDLGGGRSHWTVAGPAGVPVEWSAEVTQIVPNKVIAWKTLPGATVEHAGIVRFQPNPDGTTAVNVRLSYDPPAGAIGHTVATLFGADPKSELDADLARMKTLIETGLPARDATRPEHGEPYVH
ncbi:MAG TPA: SRPBCC family protein [Candidatus Binatia bacterium]|nr:SRPBCC family protein [Candidatus Binatia bacterium]